MKIINFAVLGLSLFGSVEGSTGGTITYVDGCNTLTAPDKCCDRPNDCTLNLDSHGLEKTLVISKGSCNGGSACERVGRLTVEENSCVGGAACFNAGAANQEGFLEDGVTPNIVNGFATVASNSCTGDASCQDIGTTGGVATIGSGSCNGGKACGSAGYAEGNAVIGDGSCLGQDTCQFIGQQTTAIVGSGSCEGRYACKFAAFGRNTGGIVIADNSCKGDLACFEIGRSKPHRIVIGSNSCNCDGCCRCLSTLVNFGTGTVVVPDNSCNSLGAGNDQCCQGDPPSSTSWGTQTVNGNFDFLTDATTVTAPSAPGSSTTTAASYAPEYGLNFGSCTFTPSDSGSPDVGSIACGFTASGGVNHTVSSEILAGDCSPDTVAPIGVVQDSSTTFVPTFEDGSTTQQNSTYDVTISLANSAVESGENITFCLMTNVFDATGDSYTFSGQKIELLISTDGGFSSEGLTTKTFDGITSSAESAGTAAFTVTAYRCDINGNRETADTELSLGENFFLCVEGSQSSVRITSIGSLTATKPETGFVPINLIVAGAVGVEGIANTNTFVYGKNSNKAVIATRLPSRFFASNEGITLTGSANIDNAGVRRLARLMQETSTLEEASDFSMDIPIVASPMFKTAGGSTKGPVGVFLLAVAAAVALFV